MGDRFPGGVISKTPPTVTGPATSGPLAGEGGSASGVWSLEEQLGLQKAGVWPKPVFPRELYAWGTNVGGRLGDGTTINRSSPVQIGALTNWMQAASGGNFSTALTTDGKLWTWSGNEFGQAGIGTREVFSAYWKSSPVQVGALTNWAQISAGKYHAAAIKTNKTFWTWGRNHYGQLGDGTVDSRSSPVQIGALTNWAQVSSGGYRTAATKTDGTLWNWGDNREGRLGDNTTISRSSPIQVGALTNWYQVSAGDNHSSAITTDGRLWSWGRNYNGQLGDDTTINRSSPVQIGALTDWLKISCGVSFSSAIKTNGTLWTWGGTGNGRLGHNNLISLSSPVQVGALTNWLNTSSGGTFCAAVKTDGTLWTWGGGYTGQLGNNLSGFPAYRSSPVQIGANTDWDQLAAGSSNSTLAITKG